MRIIALPKIVMIFKYFVLKILIYLRNQNQLLAKIILMIKLGLIIFYIIHLL